jgi:tetratricopeptide (TPR) repeat protein
MLWTFDVWSERGADVKKWILTVAVVSGVLTSGVVSAADRLGIVHFPTSCARRVQPTFEHGLALLHSFQYDEAARAFGDASRQDPHCAMSHWGQAIALYRQLWDWPSPELLQLGRQQIRRAQQIGAQTPRERAYIAAAAAFFQDRPTWSHADRIKAYSQALATVCRRFPKDVDAGAFYALSLVALANEDVAILPTLRHAIAVLQPLLAAQPNHPGVAHYLIHAADMPELAPLGLAAARKYADIAPDSSHALHMPSHIFVRLGLWPETIALNQRAAAAGAKAATEHRADGSYQLHAMDYLAYAYLQSGQEAKAREVLEELSDVRGSEADIIAFHRAFFAARNALDLHRWTEAAGLAVADIPPRYNVDTYWARTIGAARSGDVVHARENLTRLRECMDAREAQRRLVGYDAPSGTSIEVLEGEGWLSFAEGRPAEALSALREAADRDDAEGGEAIGVPAREMLADLLLELKRPAEALEVYKASLKAAPNRVDGLVGAGHAAQAAGELAKAKKYYAQLLRSTLPEGDRPEIQQAKTFLERD